MGQNTEPVSSAVRDVVLLAKTKKEAREGMLNVGLRVTLELIEFENLIDDLEKRCRQ